MVEEKSGGDDQNPKVFILVKGTSVKKERRIATVDDLFTEARSNITMVDQGITYLCGPPRKIKHNKNTLQYVKVYKCCMVHDKKQKRESGRMIQIGGPVGPSPPLFIFAGNSKFRRAKKVRKKRPTTD